MTLMFEAVARDRVASPQANMACREVSDNLSPFVATDKKTSLFSSLAPANLSGIAPGLAGQQLSPGG